MQQEEKSQNKRGFTLVELLIVMIIVGVLAAVAAPMMQSNVNRAKKSEAVAAIGAIRTAVRTYYVEYGVYPSSIWNLYQKGTLNQSDLNGKYYNYGNFGTNSVGNIYASTPAGVTGSTIVMDNNGTIVQGY